MRKLKTEHFKHYVYIAFDVETKLLGPNTKGEREHVVKIAFATHRCHDCKDRDSRATCMVCGDTEIGCIRDINFKTIKEFMSHLKERPSSEKIMLLSHNGYR